MTQTKEQRKEYERIYYQRNKEKINHYGVTHRSRLKSNGLCVSCGNPVDVGKTRCKPCLDLDRVHREEKRTLLKKRAIEYLGEKCVDCALETHFISVYDFHHKDADTKTDAIGRLIAQGKPWSVIQAALDKCVLLCANCHRIRHEMEGDTIP